MQRFNDFILEVGGKDEAAVYRKLFNEVSQGLLAIMGINPVGKHEIMIFIKNFNVVHEFFAGNLFFYHFLFRYGVVHTYFLKFFGYGILTCFP